VSTGLDDIRDEESDADRDQRIGHEQIGETKAQIPRELRGHQRAHDRDQNQRGRYGAEHPKHKARRPIQEARPRSQEKPDDDAEHHREGYLGVEGDIDP
jgi:hypothetical protein